MYNISSNMLAPIAHGTPAIVLLDAHIFWPPFNLVHADPCFS